MTDKKTYLVEHFITDKDGWASFMKKWNDVFGDKDMTIDKGLAYPEWEGNQCILTCSDVTGNLAFCIWEVPVHMTIDDFQAFIDRFTCGLSKNNCYIIDVGMGLQNLNGRGYMRNSIGVAQGKAFPSYLEAPMLFYVHISIPDPEKFETELVNKLVDSANEKCRVPSDVGKFFDSLGLNRRSLGMLLCKDNGNKGWTDEGILFSAADGTTTKDIKEMCDNVNKEFCVNTVYQIDTANCCNLMNLAEDNFHLAVLDFVENRIKTKTKQDPTIATEIPSGIHIATQ